MSSTNSTPIPPFNSLPVEISLLIIQKLSLSDVQNLALTCSKWYQTTLSLPESLKFSINYKYVDLTINGFTVLYNNEQILFTPENKFSIVKKVSIKELFINSNKIYNNGKYSCQDLVNFLYENRSYLNIDRIVLCGYFTEEYFMLVDSIVNMAYALDLKGYIMKFEEYGKHKLDAGKFIKKHLHNSYISCDMPISLATINSILKTRHFINKGKFNIILVDSIMDIVAKFMLWPDVFGSSHIETLTLIWKPEKLIEKHLALEYITCYWTMEIRTINIVLKQWVNGQRTRLNYFKCGCEDIETYKLDLVLKFHLITAGISQYVTNKSLEQVGKVLFRLTVPDVGVCYVDIDDTFFTFELKDE